MTKLLAAIALLTLASCATTPKAPSLKETHLAKQKAARAHALAQLYSPTCPAPAYYNPANCGLENESFTADLQKFTLESCQARYPRAKVAEIADWCAGHAKDCHNLSLQELRWMDSHNQTVLAELDLALNNLKKETRMAYEEQRRQLGTGATLQMSASASAASSAALSSQQAANAAASASMMAPPPTVR
jgi:hypothetical protein